MRVGAQATARGRSRRAGRSLVGALEGELDLEAGAATADADVGARARAPSACGDLVGRRLLVGMQRRAAGASAGGGAVAALRAALLEHAHRPALVGRGAREQRRRGVVVGEQQRAAVALGQRAGLEQRQRLVGQIEQPQQVGDRDAAAPDPPADLLAGEPELLDQGGARRAPPRPG